MVRERVGRYELLEQLERGGMAELFLVRPVGSTDPTLFVLKRILPERSADKHFVEMFTREMGIASMVCHPNLVAMVDHGTVDGQYFLVMEYVHGADLATLLGCAADAESRLPLDVGLTIVTNVARGLHQLHEQPDRDGRKPELVHRDVSPSNVLVAYDGQIKLADFGIATATAYTRTTEAGTVKGKMGYLSPEQVRGDPIDRRSDVFALGVLLFEATVGERLFVGDNDYAVMHSITEAKFDPPSERDPDYPAELEAIVLRALAADPADRFATASEMERALVEFAETQGLVLYQGEVSRWAHFLAPPTPLVVPPPEPDASLAAASVVAPIVATPKPSRKWVPWVAGLALLASGGAVGAVSVGSVSSPAEPTVSAEERSPAPEPRVAPPTEASSVQPPPKSVEAQPAPAAPTTPVIEVAADTPEEETEIVIEDAADSPPKRKRRRRRPKRKGARSKKAEVGYDLDAPRPPQ